MYKAAVSLCVYVCLSVPPPPFDTTVGLQHNLAGKCGLIWELYGPKHLTHPTLVGILGGQQFKSPENVTKCPENQ